MTDVWRYWRSMPAGKSRIMIFTACLPARWGVFNHSTLCLAWCSSEWCGFSPFNHAKHSPLEFMVLFLRFTRAPPPAMWGERRRTGESMEKASSYCWRSEVSCVQTIEFLAYISCRIYMTFQWNNPKYTHQRIEAHNGIQFCDAVSQPPWMY